MTTIGNTSLYSPNTPEQLCCIQPLSFARSMRGVYGGLVGSYRILEDCKGGLGLRAVGCRGLEAESQQKLQELGRRQGLGRASKGFL